jgi:uncharacterized protein (TIGR03437 family)
MKRTFSTLALALLVGAAAPAASIPTTLTLANATGSLGVTGIAVTGPVTLSNIGSGTFSATIPLAPDASGNLAGTFTITLAGADKITGTFKLPASAIQGDSFTGGSMTVTGGTGAYAGATGSFPSLSGSGSIGLSINLSFTGAGTINTGGSAGPPVPTITAVQDAASNTPNIAQGSIFIVKGTNLSASGYTPFAPPRPTVSPSGSVKVTFTPVAGGSGTDVILVYLYNLPDKNGIIVNQIACILPSTVAVGNYNVTVTNGTASDPFLAQVVANKIGLFTQDSTGGGLTSLQNYISATVVDLNRLTTGSISGITISPAHPGQAVIAYGTGLGPLAAADNNPAVAYFDFSKSMTIQAIVGGVSIPVAYAGRAGYPGEDQINFTLPGNVQTGCAVPLQISVNGNLSAVTSISIAPDANASACVMPGYSTAQLQKFDNGGTYTIGAFNITQFTETVQGQTVKIDSIGGGFKQITAFQLGAAATLNPTIGMQSGSCIVTPFTTSGTPKGTVSTGKVPSLDAGVVSINGPAGSSLTNQVITEDENYDYSIGGFEGLGITIPGQISFSLVAGTYTLSGAGGKDVGTFSTSLTLGSPLTITGGLPSTVNRSAGLPLNWTGGLASDIVEIVGLSYNTTGTGENAVSTGAEFICTTTAGQGTFTVPASILTQLPASAAGFLLVNSGNNSATFTASLKAGGSIDAGYFGSFLGILGSPVYQ